MKIKALHISNVLSFKFFENIEDAASIFFDKNFNILIGENGAGKSTALEIINFVFKRALFLPYNKNQELYKKRSEILSEKKRQILAPINEVKNYNNFRLDRNYDYEDKTQKIRVVIALDDIDRANIDLLRDNKDKIASLLGVYATEEIFTDGDYLDEYIIDIELNSTNKTFTAVATEDVGYKYLKGYNLYKEIIAIHNEENEADQIKNLSEPFTLIGSYRNYNAFSPHVSLGRGNIAQKQIQQERSKEFSKSTNSIESGEPSIFSLVRLQMADECQRLITTEKTQDECQREANNLGFVKKINEKISIVGLRVEIFLTDVSSWNYTFSFVDIGRGSSIKDINALSAGQKAIIHLVFEAYGRGNLQGGVIIIDEPEIHLHYQFQNEYLRVIEKLNEEQGCQYILVTHSEALINSKTISNVVRLSRNLGFTEVNQPSISEEQRWLIKILDNKRSTHAFFGSKVLLVEGETDRYFFRALLDEIDNREHNGVSQDVTVLDINEKAHLDKWRGLFESFGLKSFFLTDLDTAFKFYPGEDVVKINTKQLAEAFIDEHSTDLIKNIESEYAEGIFILQKGDLEIYLDIHQKGLTSVIKFCSENLSAFIDDGNSYAKEILNIVSKITRLNV